jgi:hypothetical protein
MAYRHYDYLATIFPERIKKARENKIVDKKLLDETDDTQVLTVKSNFLLKKPNRKH